MKRFLLVITGCILGAFNASAIDFTLVSGYASAYSYDAYENYNPEFSVLEPATPTLPDIGTVSAIANSVTTTTGWKTVINPNFATLEMNSIINIVHDPNSIEKNGSSYALYQFNLNGPSDYSIAGGASWQRASSDTVYYGIQLLFGDYPNEQEIYSVMENSHDVSGQTSSYKSGQLVAGYYTLMFSVMIDGDPGEGHATFGNAYFKLTLGSTNAVPESGMTLTLLAVALGLLATLSTFRRKFQG